MTAVTEHPARTVRGASAAGAVAGAAGALAGHAVSVAAAYLAGWLATGGRSSDDLEAGGNFAVAYWGLMTFGAAEFLLFFGCLLVGVSALRRRAALAAGVFAGWATGALLLAAAVGGLIYLASRPPG